MASAAMALHDESSSEYNDSWESEYDRADSDDEKGKGPSMRTRFADDRYTHAHAHAHSNSDPIAAYFNDIHDRNMVPYGPQSPARDSRSRPFTHSKRSAPLLPARANGPPISVAIFPPESSKCPPQAAKESFVSVENPSSQRDYTIHIELDIEEDIDDKIENLVKLRRLGRFQDAATYFHENMPNNLQEHAVVGTYAELLLEQGDYERLFESFDDYKISSLFTPYAVSEYADLNLLDDCNLVLILELARCHNSPDLYRSVYMIESVSRRLRSKFLGDQDEIDTAMHKIRCRLLTLLGYIHANGNLIHENNIEFADKLQKEVGSYQDYLGDGRHWDLRDVVYAFHAAFGPIRTCKRLFQTDSLDAGVSELVHAWERVLPDDTSDICLLDILVCFCRGHIQVLENDSKVINTASVAFEQARRVATAVKNAGPENTKCRPYLNWILVEMAHARAVDSARETNAAQVTKIGSRCFCRLPGFTYWDSVLPIYVPLVSENPGWPVTLSNTSASTESENLLAVVQRAAEELGDFSTQVACLREIICRSPAPHSLFDDLNRLQHSVMGDKLGMLQTRLSRYLISDTTASRRQLHQDLVIINTEIDTWLQTAHPMMQWCYYRITAALRLAFEGFTAEAKAADSRADSLRSLIPEGFVTDKRWYQYIPTPLVPHQSGGLQVHYPRHTRKHSRRHPLDDDDRPVAVEPTEFAMPMDPPTVSEKAGPSRAAANTRTKKKISRSNARTAKTLVEDEEEEEEE